MYTQTTCKMHQTIKIVFKKNANQQIHINKKRNNNMLFLLHKRFFLIISLFIYNVMNLTLSCNYFGHLCNVVKCGQLMVLDVNMNYVDHKIHPW
jgi:hypothetical protein